MSQPRVARGRLQWLREGDLTGPTRFHLERRRIRCGKVGCGRLHATHGPYFYLRVTGDDGNRRRIYVPRRSAHHVRRWAAEFREGLRGLRLAMRLAANW